MPAHRGPVGPPAHVHVVRRGRLLRLVAQPAREQARGGHRPSHRPLHGARRGVVVVLRRRSRLRRPARVIELDERAKRLVLLAAILGSSIAFIDGTVVNVALPAIAEDLDTGLAGQQWIVEAYLLTLSSLLLVGGSLGDHFGRRRVFELGVGGFGVTSVLCAAAPNTEVLIAGRALQGMAGALLIPGTLALIVNTFPPSERGAAIGSWTAWSGIAGVLGPFI